MGRDVVLLSSLKKNHRSLFQLFAFATRLSWCAYTANTSRSSLEASVNLVNFGLLLCVVTYAADLQCESTSTAGLEARAVPSVGFASIESSQKPYNFDE